MKVSKKEKEIAQRLWNDIEYDICPASCCCGKTYGGDNYDYDVISVDCIKNILEYYGVDFEYLDKFDLSNSVFLSNKKARFKLTRKGKKIAKERNKKGE